MGGAPAPPTPPTFFVGRSRGLPENSWKIHGFPWVSMGPHGVPWGPMGSHGVPMASMEIPRMSEIIDFNENHYSVRQKIGDPGSKSMRNIFPLHPVTPKRPESPYGAKYLFWPKIQFFSFSATGVGKWLLQDQLLGSLGKHSLKAAPPAQTPPRSAFASEFTPHHTP